MLSIAGIAVAAYAPGITLYQIHLMPNACPGDEHRLAAQLLCRLEYARLREDPIRQG